MVSGRCKFLKEWPEWDVSVHDDEAQISRQARCMTYPFSFDIDENKKTARFSSTTDLPYYETSLSGCTCYDFQERHLPCKHMYRLAVELGIIEIIKRSSFDRERIDEIKNSSDVDSDPDQMKRQKSAAKCKVVSIDYKAKTAIFAGSGKTPYETTLDSCTCRDFVVRKLPCKHIYRFRQEISNHSN